MIFRFGEKSHVENASVCPKEAVQVGCKIVEEFIICEPEFKN